MPTTKSNSEFDHYELLTHSKCSSNAACCFTNLGRQEPGQFNMKNNMKGKLGHLIMNVYRSFGYFQLNDIEEFKTPDGIPYWYNARTGETFWEQPLHDMNADEEEEGRLIDDGEDDENEKGLYSEARVRKHMLTNYEKDEVSETKMAMMQAKQGLKDGHGQTGSGGGGSGGGGGGGGDYRSKKIKIKDLDLSKTSVLKQRGTGTMSGGMLSSRSMASDAPSTSRRLSAEPRVYRIDAHGKYRDTKVVSGASTARSDYDAFSDAGGAGGGMGGGFVSAEIGDISSARGGQVGSGGGNSSSGGEGGTVARRRSHEVQQRQQALQVATSGEAVAASTTGAESPMSQAQTNQILHFISDELQRVLPTISEGKDSSAQDALKIGLGLGLGLGIRASTSVAASAGGGSGAGAAAAATSSAAESARQQMASRESALSSSSSSSSMLSGRAVEESKGAHAHAHHHDHDHDHGHGHGGAMLKSSAGHGSTKKSGGSDKVGIRSRGKQIQTVLPKPTATPDVAGESVVLGDEFMVVEHETHKAAGAGTLFRSGDDQGEWRGGERERERKREGGRATK